MRRVWAWMTKRTRILTPIAAAGSAGVALWHLFGPGDISVGLWAAQAALWATIVLLQDREIRDMAKYTNLGRVMMTPSARTVVVDMASGDGKTFMRHTFTRTTEEHTTDGHQ